MRSVLIAFLAVTIGCSTPSYGEDATASKPAADLASEIEGLKTQNTALHERLTKLQEENEALTSRLDALSNSIGKWLEDDSLTERVARLSLAVNDIALHDGDRYVPSLRASMDKSPRFRKDVYDATNGTLELQNNTGRWMELYVNGARWNLPPGATNISVPYGPVHLKFVYFRRNKEWTWKEKDWHHDGATPRLSIQINPGSASPSS